LFGDEVAGVVQIVWRQQSSSEKKVPGSVERLPNRAEVVVFKNHVPPTTLHGECRFCRGLSVRNPTNEEKYSSRANSRGDLPQFTQSDPHACMMLNI
jgi:hypothetical protein